MADVLGPGKTDNRGARREGPPERKGVKMAGKERAGWEYVPGREDPAEDILGMSDQDAQDALRSLIETVAAAAPSARRLELADAEMAEAFGPCGAECQHAGAVR